MRKAIDWNAIKARLAQTQAMFESGHNDDPVRMAAIFDERAKRLAARQSSALDEPAGLAVLSFKLGDITYAIEHAEIAEVLPMGQFTPVPAAPPELIGVINLRSEIVAVVDLARLLNAAQSSESQPGTGAGYVLVLRHHDVCLKVDHVSQIRHIQARDIEPGMALTEEHAAHYVKGIARDATLILCVETILTHALFETV